MGEPQQDQEGVQSHNHHQENPKKKIPPHHKKRNTPQKAPGKGCWGKGTRNSGGKSAVSSRTPRQKKSRLGSLLSKQRKNQRETPAMGVLAKGKDKKRNSRRRVRGRSRIMIQVASS